MLDSTKVEKKPEPQELLEAALRLTELGYVVTPAYEKHPFLPNWQNDDVLDRQAVIEKFKGKRYDGLAIVTKHPLIVIDFDVENESEEPWKDYDLPPTVITVTGSFGRHYYYRLPFIGLRCGNFKLAKKIDVKAEGGCAIVPPSWHYKKNRRYRWLEGHSIFEHPIAEAPKWFIEKLKPHAVRTTAEKLYTINPPIKQGMRHNYLTSLGGLLCLSSLSKEEIRKILYEVYDRFIEKGDFDIDKEIDGILNDYENWTSSDKDLDISKAVSKLPSQVAEVVVKSAGLLSVSDKKSVQAPVFSNRKKITKEELARNTLLEADWISIGAMKYIRDGHLLIYFDDAASYLANRGISVSDDIAKRAARSVLLYNHAPDFKGIVLGDYTVYADWNGIRGFWRYYGDTLYCHTPNGVLSWSKGTWPEGVCIIADLNNRGGVYVDDSGEPDDLFEYIEVASYRINAKTTHIISMIVPVLYGCDNAGFLLTGPAGSGKSTFAKAMALLERGAVWGDLVGQQPRDFVAALRAQRITFFDDTTDFDSELLRLLKSKVTRDVVAIRDLYSNNKVSFITLDGSVFLCTPSLEGFSKDDFLSRLFELSFSKKGSHQDYRRLMSFFEEKNAKARGGALKLLTSVLATIDDIEDVPDFRFHTWSRFAYGIARHLGEADSFLEYVMNSKTDAMSNSKYGFLVEAFSRNMIEPNKEYHLSDIWIRLGNDPNDVDFIGLARGLKVKGNAASQIRAIAQDFGFDVILQKKKSGNKGKTKVVMIFVKNGHPNPPDDTPPTDPPNDIEDNTDDNSDPLSFDEPYEPIDMKTTQNTRTYQKLIKEDWEQMVLDYMKHETPPKECDHKKLKEIKERLEKMYEDFSTVRFLHRLTESLNKKESIEYFSKEENKELLEYILPILATARLAVKRGGSLSFFANERGTSIGIIDWS